MAPDVCCDVLGLRRLPTRCRGRRTTGGLCTKRFGGHDISAITLAISGGGLPDGFGGDPLDDAVVPGDKIASLGRVGQVVIPKGIKVIDGSGMTIMPGLWESHGHLMHAAEGEPTDFPVKFKERMPRIMADVAKISLMATSRRFGTPAGPLAEQQQLRADIEQVVHRGRVCSGRTDLQASEQGGRRHAGRCFGDDAPGRASRGRTHHRDEAGSVEGVRVLGGSGIEQSSSRSPRRRTGHTSASMLTPATLRHTGLRSKRASIVCITSSPPIRSPTTATKIFGSWCATSAR
jgi:hypothetical protein